MWVLLNSFFIFSNFYKLIYTSKLVLHLQNYDECLQNLAFSLILLWLTKARICWLLNWIHMYHHSCSLLNVSYLGKNWRHSPISFKHVLFMDIEQEMCVGVFVLWSSPNHASLKYRCTMKKMYQVFARL